MSYGLKNDDHRCPDAPHHGGHHMFQVTSDGMAAICKWCLVVYYRVNAEQAEYVKFPEMMWVQWGEKK